jgi:hypothetical protein
MLTFFRISFLLEQQESVRKLMFDRMKGTGFTGFGKFLSLRKIPENHTSGAKARAD